MTESLSGISSVSANMSTQSVGYVSLSSQALTEETKKKLEALGIDTKYIRTEQEGKQKLQEIEQSQKAQQAAQQQNIQPQQPTQQQDGSIATLITNIKDLAQQVGVSVGMTSNIEDVLANIKTKISDMQATKTVNSVEEDSKAKAASYQLRYETLYNEYESKKNSQNKLTSSLNAMALYNMAMM